MQRHKSRKAPPTLSELFVRYMIFEAEIKERKLRYHRNVGLQAVIGFFLKIKERATHFSICFVEN